MTQYKTLNVKLSNSQLNKLKLRLKNGTKITLKLSSNVIGDSNDENTHITHKFQKFVKLLQMVHQLI